MATIEVDADGDEMAVERVGSPTEIAADTDEELEPKVEKRKRETRGREGGVLVAGGVAAPAESDDDELDSPTKRALKSSGHSDDRQLTAGLLRDLLADHRRDLQQAWTVFEGRLGKVESQQLRQTGELASLNGRVKINEKDVSVVKKDLATGEKRVDKLTEEVQIEGVNAKMNEVHSGKGEVNAEAGGAGDPWGDYLRRQRAGGDITGTSKSAAPNTGGQGGLGGELASSDQLSEEDRRTLIVGGWLQDTRRVTIEEEVAPLLSHPDIKPLLDVERLAIYGPRRSVGMLKFNVRSDEGRPEDLRARMWKVVRKISELKMPVESARAMGEDRTMWASFVKTKAAGTRSSHISMARRVVMGLAADAKNEAGGVLNYEHTQLGAYDMDWNAGTIWCGVHKLASSTHRCPREAETITMTGGWINLDAVGLIASCSTEVAKTTFEKEL
eukprot:s139_g15.t1